MTTRPLHRTTVGRRRRASVGVVLTIVASALVVVSTAAPAAATVHDYELDMVRGTFSMGAVVDRSWDGTLHPCWGRTTLTGSIDDSTGTDNMSGTFDLVSDDFTNPYVTGHYVLELSDSATGADAADYDTGTRTFTGLALDAVWAIRSIDPTTCALGSTVCTGSAQLTLAGELLAGPPFGAGTEADVVSTSGVITGLSSCSNPWSLMLPWGAGIAVVPVLGSGEPAARFVHPESSYDTVMTDGRIALGGLAYDEPVPWGVGYSCPSTLGLGGTIDTSGTTDDITGTLTGRSRDFPGITGRYALTLSGSATGTDAGDYATTTRSFTGLHIPSASFAVRSIDPTTCALGSTVCSGTATLTLDGTLVNGAEPPLVAWAETVVTSTAGSILTRGTCSWPWAGLINVGNDVTVGPNPAWAEPGAYFTQL